MLIIFQFTWCEWQGSIESSLWNTNRLDQKGLFETWVSPVLPLSGPLLWPLLGLNTCQCFLYQGLTMCGKQELLSNCSYHQSPKTTRLNAPSQQRSFANAHVYIRYAWPYCFSTKCLWFSETLDTSQTKAIFISRVRHRALNDPKCSGHGVHPCPHPDSYSAEFRLKFPKIITLSFAL
jgi:hypothetical protein